MAQVAYKTIAQTVDAAILSLGKTIVEFFTSVILANSRSCQFETLNALTDVELADQYGIKRDQIVSFVFHDKLI